jgi:hypothetical protein
MRRTRMSRRDAIHFWTHFLSALFKEESFELEYFAVNGEGRKS